MTEEKDNGEAAPAEETDTKAAEKSSTSSTKKKSRRKKAVSNDAPKPWYDQLSSRRKSHLRAEQ